MDSQAVKEAVKKQVTLEYHTNNARTLIEVRYPYLEQFHFHI